MKDLILTPVTYVWLLLAALTVLSWGLVDNSIDPSEAPQWIGIALMVLAFFKVRLVIMHFMEVATAPIPLRVIFEIWVIVVCAAIILMFLGLLNLNI